MAHVNFFEKRVGIFGPDIKQHSAMIAYARGSRAAEVVHHNTTPQSSSLADDVQLTAELIRAGGFGIIVTQQKDPVATSALEILDMIGSPHPTVLQQIADSASGEILMHIGKTPYRVIPAAAGQLSVASTII